MFDCKDVTQLISQSMDISLPIGKRIAVRIHLLTCIFCTRYKRQLHLIRETLRRLSAAEDHPEGPTVEKLSAEAQDRIKKSLRDP